MTSGTDPRKQPDLSNGVVAGYDALCLFHTIAGHDRM